jgi:hypothetical protein
MSDEDDGLDEEDRVFWSDLCRSLRQEVVVGVLRAVDSPCFTTEEYCNEYRKHWPPPNGFELKMEVAEMHLRGLAELVEVSPGVWTPEIFVDMHVG